ncbi:MAG: ABC transporter substrate-binding protein [Candidatus Eremiobacteraeota bacterium]|nr:ABC transporter substrate-binding protein [Candidatus Eremiobacteraeota bacterium]
MRVLLACTLTGVLLLASQAKSISQAPLEFNYGIPTADHATVFVAQDLGLFEKAGLKPTFYYFTSGAPLLAALKSGSIDVATAGLALTFALGENIPLKFIFWEANNSAAEGLIVDPHSRIRSFRDVAKAGAIAAASGTCAQVALYLMAKKVGVDYRKLNVVDIPAPLLQNAFLSHSIDAGIAWPPYSEALKAEGFRIASYDEAYTPPGGDCPGMTAVRPAFLQQHGEIGVKLLEVEAMARAAIAKNPQVGVNAFVKHLSITPAVAKATLERECCGRVPSFADQLSPTSPFSMTSRDGGTIAKLVMASDALYQTKVLSAPIPLSTLQAAVDPQYLREYMAAHVK